MSFFLNIYDILRNIFTVTIYCHISSQFNNEFRVKFKSNNNFNIIYVKHHNLDKLSCKVRNQYIVMYNNMNDLESYNLKVENVTDTNTFINELNKYNVYTEFIVDKMCMRNKVKVKWT